MKELRDESKYETSYPLDYYLEIAKLATQIINDCYVTGEHLRTVYLDFLTLVRTCHREKRLPTLEEKNYFKNLDLTLDKSEDEEDWNEKKPKAVSGVSSLPYHEKVIIRKPKKR